MSKSENGVQASCEQQASAKQETVSTKSEARDGVTVLAANFSDVRKLRSERPVQQERLK
jgi:hypothetical protein